jgi:hypothetical protein
MQTDAGAHNVHNGIHRPYLMELNLFGGNAVYSAFGLG